MPSTASRPAIARRGARIAPRLACTVASAGFLIAAAPVATATPPQTPLLAQGSRGAAVSRLQRALRVALTVEGIVGPHTWDALVGIKPAHATGGTGSTSPGDYAIPSAIVQCESGGNYSAVNQQSGAGGAYQIIPSTWRAYGGQGLPQNAPKAEQDHIAAKIYARQGRSAWSC